MTDTHRGTARAPLTIRLTAALVRRRVALGFVTAAVVLLLAQPGWMSWAAGLLVASAGAGLRMWAAGHLEKSREVTRSGPYRWTRHPLYLGSSIIALGVVIAAQSIVVAVVAAVYMTTTLSAAVRNEEAFLRGRFGDEYDRYSAARAEPMARPFSWARAQRNREHRALLGLVAGFGLLALKVALPI